MNIYGTEKYRRYIEEYLSDLVFEKKKEENARYGGLDAKLEFFECSFDNGGCPCHAERTVMTIEDGRGDHVYECIDAFMPPCEFEYGGEEYVVFRRTLYGYTILNLTDFSERNYFPSDVAEGKEAFIMCEATRFCGMLLLFGCFWAGPYMCYALDLETLDVLNLSGALGMEDVADNGIRASGDTLVLTDGNTDKTYSVGCNELKALVAASGNKDL